MSSRTDAAVRATWRVRLAIRERLLAAARKRHAAKSVIAKRIGQVAAAKRVIARHTPEPPSKVSTKGLELIERFEGFRANVYQDSVGVWTQGFGETSGTTPGHPWTREYAEQRLRQRVDRDYTPPVLNAARGHITLKQQELDALVSLAYNVGPGVFGPGHTMGDAIRSGSRSRIAAAFGVYDIAGGHVLPGLVTRRQAERHFFLYGS